MPAIDLIRHCLMYLPRHLWLSRLRKNTAGLDTRGHRVIVLITSDTEFDPPIRSGTWDNRSITCLKDGLPRLLEACENISAPATLFSEGKLVETLPDLFREISRRHEIGCHSFAHEWLGTRPPPKWIPHWEELAVLSSESKAGVVGRAIESITAVIGKKPAAFKAPFNSVDSPSTLMLLDKLGFTSDSSLPAYDNTSFAHPLRPTPTRHISNRGLWSEGRIRLVEVPFMIRPRPLLLHPFDTREELTDTVARGMKLALESVDTQCRIDVLSGRKFSAVHITSHPWEFSARRPDGGNGRKTCERLSAFVEELMSAYDVEFLCVTDYVRKWEKECCPLHSSTSSNRRVS